MRDEKAFSEFASQVRRDIEGVLGKYDIADKSMQAELLRTLLPLDILEGKDDLALQHIAAIRAGAPASRIYSCHASTKPSAIAIPGASVIAAGRCSIASASPRWGTPP